MTADGDTGPVVFTLGHSRYPIGDFVALLRRHGVETVVDVRGQPYSRFNPQFNREPFEEALAAEGLCYRWEGEHLSGRPQDRRFYRPDGKVDWTAVRRSPAFAAALDAVLDLARCETVVLVCAEEDPLQCHRRFLLTPPLIDRKARVFHIRKTGSLESESDAAARARKADPGQMDMFD